MVRKERGETVRWTVAALFLLVACHSGDKKKVRLVVTVAGRAAVVWSGSHLQEVGVISAEGAPQWHVNTTAFMMQLVASREELITIDDQGLIVSYDAKSGRPLWHVQYSKDDEIILGNDYLAASSRKRVEVIDLTRGAIRAHFDGVLMRPPLVAGDYVVLESDNRTMSIRASDGKTTTFSGAGSCVMGGNLLTWENGNLVEYDLADRSGRRVVASVPDEAWRIDDCASYKEKRVLVITTFSYINGVKRALVVLDGPNTVGRIELSGQSDMSRWRSNTGLRGSLTRFIPVSVEGEVRIVDLDTVKFSEHRAPSEFSPIIFGSKNIWFAVWDGKFDVLRLDGATGEIKADVINGDETPPIRPQELDGGVLWLPGVLSSQTAQQFKRLDLNLRQLF